MGTPKLEACVRPSNDGVQPYSRFPRVGMKLDPINTILGNIVGIEKVNFPPVRSKGVLIGVVLESGEVNARSIDQVLSVDTKRPIENRTKGVGLMFMIWFVI